MDIYAAVTDRIIEQMEQGIIGWHGLPSSERKTTAKKSSSQK